MLFYGQPAAHKAYSPDKRPNKHIFFAMLLALKLNWFTLPNHRMLQGN